MKNIEIITTQNVVLQYELAALKDRALAFLLDALIMIVSFSILVTLGTAFTGGSESAAACSIPLCSRGVAITPDHLAGRSIECEWLYRCSHGIQNTIYNDRITLNLATVPGMIFPRNIKVFNIICADLIKLGKMISVRSSEVLGPVCVFYIFFSLTRLNYQ